MVDQEVMQCDLGGHSSHTVSIEHLLHATQETVSTVFFRLNVMLTVYTSAPCHCQMSLCIISRVLFWYTHIDAHRQIMGALPIAVHYTSA